MKACFFDLDGTLLTSQKKISPRTMETLIHCHERRIALFAATARPPLLARMLSWDEHILSLFEGGVYCNGACRIAGRIKEYTTVPDELVVEILKLICLDKSLNIALQLEGELQAFRFLLSQSAFTAWGLAPKEALPLSEAQGLQVVKLLVFYNSLIDSVMPIGETTTRRLEELCRGRAQFYLSDGGRAIQIMGNGVNKYTGVKRICALYGFEPQDIVVFGDDVNDLELLAAYPNSFAMGNADIHIREVARYTTLDNDHDGIAVVLDNIIRP